DLPRLAKLIDLDTGNEQSTIPLQPGASNLEDAATGAGIVGTMFFRNNVVVQVLDYLPAGISDKPRPRYLPTTDLHDAQTGAHLARLPVDPSQAWLSPNGQTLVGWYDGQLTIWDVPPSSFTLTWFALSAGLGILILLFTRWFTRRLRRIY